MVIPPPSLRSHKESEINRLGRAEVQTCTAELTPMMERWFFFRYGDVPRRTDRDTGPTPGAGVRDGEPFVYLVNTT